MPSLPLRAITLAFALAPAMLAAQQAAPVGTVGSDGRIVVTPSIGLLTRVRFAEEDTTTVLTRPRPVGRDQSVEGRLVSYDGEFATLDLPRGYRFTIPVANLSEFEQRVGPGPCRRTTAGRALCTLGLVGGGMLVGRVAGERIGEAVVDPGVDSRPYAMRGAILGTVIGLAMLPSIGRDEWVTVPLPPR